MVCTLDSSASRDLLTVSRNSSRPRRSVEDACAPRKLPMLVADGRLSICYQLPPLRDVSDYWGQKHPAILVFNLELPFDGAQ